MAEPSLRPAAQRISAIGYGVLLRTRRRNMRFILVNGRMRCRQSFCAMCDEAVGANYLREVGTDLITSYYDDHLSDMRAVRQQLCSI